MRKTTLNHRHQQHEIDHYVIYVIVFIIIVSRNDRCTEYMWIHVLVNSPTPQSSLATKRETSGLRDWDGFEQHRWDIVLISYYEI